MEIDDAIDALLEVLAKVGIDPPRPSDPVILTEIAAAIAPLRLPADLRRFWERIDPETLRVDVYPEFCTPRFGLTSWQSARQEFPEQPAILFLIAYQSWACVSVELGGEHGEGGVLFQWELSDGDFQLGYHHIGDWLVRIADLIVSGSYERREGQRGPWLSIADEWDEELFANRRADGRLHPIYGAATAVPRAPIQWPPHWQRASGIEAEDIPPRGATHTIADALGSDPASEIRATIAGRVINLAGSSAETRVRVTDGTETIDIVCPTATTALGPVVGESFEFDVVIAPGVRRRMSDTKVDPGDPSGALEALTATLMSRYGGPAEAMATAVRPCESIAD